MTAFVCGEKERQQRAGNDEEFSLREMRPLLLLHAEAAFDSDLSVGVRCAGLTRDARCAGRVDDFRREEPRGGRKDARTGGRRRRGCNRCGSKGDGR
jgi:hypothetical protein